MTWLKRNTTGLARSKELVEMYESLGFEVKVEPMDFGELDKEVECNECFKHGQENFVTIYTKPKTENSKR
ncbi:hypothetical protein ISS30_06955 [bacterium]|nr:hypothetical protein [FCB group bacterium]MBL7191418.1 hypothetical protein [bacterium]